MSSSYTCRSKKHLPSGVHTYLNIFLVFDFFEFRTVKWSLGLLIKHSKIEVLVISLLRYFYTWLFLTVAADIDRRENGYFKGVFNVVYEGRLYSVLRALRNVPLQECMYQCTQHLNCKTANYNPKTTECELTDEDFKDWNSYKTKGWLNYGTPPKGKFFMALDKGSLDKYLKCKRELLLLI